MFKEVKELKKFPKIKQTDDERLERGILHSLLRTKKVF